MPLEAAGLVVGLSGGPDSAALLHAAAALGNSFRALPLRALHVDHGLQPAAADFRAACVSLCEKLGVPLRIVAAAVSCEAGVSLEAAARSARYAALELELQPWECLLTAHHREDQAETLLLQALRGAGVKGMSAMPLCRPFGAGWHVRPLLNVAHSDLQQFGDLGTSPAIDPMNRDMRFDRVYLRTALWPLIERRWPGAATALTRAARHMAEAQQLLERAAETDLGRLRDGDALSIPGLRALSAPQRANAVRLWLSQAGLEAPSTTRLIEALRQVFDADADHSPAILWGAQALRRYRQRLFVTPADPARMAQPRSWSVAAGSAVELGPGLGSLAWIELRGGIAAERLPARLVVRRREGGETLKPAAGAKTQSCSTCVRRSACFPGCGTRCRWCLPAMTWSRLGICGWMRGGAHPRMRLASGSRGTMRHC